MTKLMIDHHTIWENCLQTIRKQVNAQSFKTWFEPIQAVAINEKILTILVPNKFFYEWLEENYVSLLRNALRQELGDKARLEYQIMMKKSGVQQKARQGSAVNPPNNKISLPKQAIKNPFVIPGIKKMRIDAQLNPTYLFENYIEGDCNRLARSAGVAVAKKPGGTAFNPLFIFGNVGLGKTHLAHAIGNEVKTKHPDKTILYVSSEKFTNQFIESLKNNAVNDFVNFYQLVDVLIVDDIQFLANKQKTQDIFFHIFNQIHQGNKQLILTSDRPPKELNGMEERLISRFKWGLSADLQVPDFETRRAIVESKMSGEGVELPVDVSEFIAYNIKNNIRELEGVLISLVAQSSLNRREVDIELAKEVIKNFVSEISKEITVGFIQKMVAEHYDLNVEKLKGKTRKRSIVIARQLSMYLAKNMTNKSLKVIGDNFGGRDHSTVIYSCKAVSDLLDTDEMFKNVVEELEKKIQMSVYE